MSLRVSRAPTQQKMKLLSVFRETSNQCGKQARGRRAEGETIPKAQDIRAGAEID